MRYSQSMVFMLSVKKKKLRAEISNRAENSEACIHVRTAIFYQLLGTEWSAEPLWTASRIIANANEFDIRSFWRMIRSS